MTAVTTREFAPDLTVLAPGSPTRYPWLEYPSPPEGGGTGATLHLGQTMVRLRIPLYPRDLGMVDDRLVGTMTVRAASTQVVAIDRTGMTRISRDSPDRVVFGQDALAWSVPEPGAPWNARILTLDDRGDTPAYVTPDAPDDIRPAEPDGATVEPAAFPPPGVSSSFS